MGPCNFRKKARATPYLSFPPYVMFSPAVYAVCYRTKILLRDSTSYVRYLTASSIPALIKQPCPSCVSLRL